MNARRVHELMLKNFPEFNAANHEWVNVMDLNGPRAEILRELVDQFIDAPDMLVEVHRRLGGMFPKEQALEFIFEHIGKGQIRASSRAFSGYLVIASSGVATAWSREA